MFMPAEYLTAAQLAVPVMTSINGVSHVGDLAHDHENEEDHDDECEDEMVAESAATMSLFAPFDFDAFSRLLGSSVSRVLATHSGELQNPIDNPLVLPTYSNAQSEWIDVVALSRSPSNESSLSLDSESITKIDSVFSDTEDGWYTFRGIVS